MYDIVYRDFFEDNQFNCFRGFTATSKIILENLIIVYKWNDSLVDPQNLIREMHH